MAGTRSIGSRRNARSTRKTRPEHPPPWPIRPRGAASQGRRLQRQKPERPHRQARDRKPVRQRMLPQRSRPRPEAASQRLRQGMSPRRQRQNAAALPRPKPKPRVRHQHRAGAANRKRPPQRVARRQRQPEDARQGLHQRLDRSVQRQTGSPHPKTAPLRTRPRIAARSRIWTRRCLQRPQDPLRRPSKIPYRLPPGWPFAPQGCAKGTGRAVKFSVADLLHCPFWQGAAGRRHGT